MRIGDDFRGYLISFQGFPACQSFLGGISELDTQANGLSTGLASEADLRVVAIVQTVEEDAHASLAAVQTNPPWGLDRVDQKRLPLDRLFHPRSVLREIDVYIVDTGIRIDHADFEGRAVWGVTTRTGSPDMDDNGHGSHVAGIVGGRFAGVSKSSNLIAIKALDEEGRGPYSELIAGLQWVADRVSQQPSRPAVVNLSVQGRESDILQSAIKALSNLGVHVVAAAGNKGQPSCNFSPASTTPNTPLISVGAM
ncbi:alkaline serine protease [Cladochytrium replicatum]|nr:alkaline serine protease [Cladochytrium replicatum]